MRSVAGPAVTIAFLASTIRPSTALVAVAVLLVFSVLVGAYMAVRAGAAEERRRIEAMSTATIPGSGAQRYRVTVRTADDGAFTYAVVTGVDSKRAASIAFDEHGRTQGSEPGASDVQDVQVEHLGAARRTADGKVDFEQGDLFDRSEF